MAELVSDDTAQAEPEERAKEKPVKRITPFHPHDERKLQRRFAIAFMLLAALIGAAVGFLIVSIGRSTTTTESRPVAAPFNPTGIGTAALQEIASHVGPEYRLTNGEQLVGVIPRTAAPPELVTPAGVVAVSTLIVHTGFPIENPRDVQVFDFSKGAMYFLCGTGKACALPGKPSLPRGELLRREAVELSLLTLRRLVSVDSVLVFLPPSSTAKPFVFLRRPDLDKELAQPLSATLAPVKTLAPGSLSAKESQRLNTLTDRHIFVLQSVQQLPDGSAYFYATPPPIG